MERFLPPEAGPQEVAAFFNVSRESLDLLQTYFSELARWQKRINLVGPKELERFWSRHIGDALQLCEFIDSDCKEIVDMGSGGGIPGIVMAILLKGTSARVHLVESNAKKAAFLREIVRKLDLAAEVHCNRVEALDLPLADIVTARALAPLPILLDYAEKRIKNGGELLFLKGLDVVSELTETTKYWNIAYEKQVSRVSAQGCILHIKGFQRVEVSQQGEK